MTMNENVLKGKWLEIRGEVRKTWGLLTDDELEKTKGDMKQIAGLIQQKYGATQDSFMSKLSGIYSHFEEKKDQVVSNIKDAVK